jgi:nucleotide-binding universal stress UspA family protein
MASMAAQPRRVLVGYDGTEASRKALDVAAGLIGYGSTLAVATVEQTGAPTANIVLSEAREWLLQHHLPAAYLPLHGDPADELVDAASYLDADLVVVGRRSQNGEARPAMGPVSTEVAQRAPCDVLVVK